VVSLHRIHEMSKIVVEESPRSCQVKTEALLKPHLIEVQRKKFLSFQVSNDPVFSVINILKTPLKVRLHWQNLYAKTPVISRCNFAFHTYLGN
jgi:hypothetical protein